MWSFFQGSFCFMAALLFCGALKPLRVDPHHISLPGCMLNGFIFMWLLLDDSDVFLPFLGSIFLLRMKKDVEEVKKHNVAKGINNFLTFWSAFGSLDVEEKSFLTYCVSISEPAQIAASYLYLHFSIGLSNGQLAEYPLALRCPVASIRRRHEFLAKLHLDKYTPGTPGYLPLASLLHSSDKYFAVNVARSFLVSYNAFLKRY